MKLVGLTRLSHHRLLVKMESWLRLTFFVCLHNQLSSINSVETCYPVHMFKQVDSPNKQK